MHEKKRIVTAGIFIFLIVSCCFSIIASAETYDKFNFNLESHNVEDKSLYFLAKDKETQFNVTSSIPVHIYIITSDAYYDIWLSSPYDEDDFLINVFEKKNITDASFTWILPDDQSYYFIIFNPNDINATVSYSFQETLFEEIGEGFGEAIAGLFAGICVGTLCFIAIVFYFILSVVIAIWMLRDADKRGRDGGLWCIAGLILGVVGLIIWFIIRPKKYKEKTKTKEADRICPNCGRVIPMDARICPYCSKNFEEKK